MSRRHKIVQEIVQSEKAFVTDIDVLLRVNTLLLAQANCHVGVLPTVVCKLNREKADLQLGPCSSFKNMHYFFLRKLPSLYFRACPLLLTATRRCPPNWKRDGPPVVRTMQSEIFFCNSLSIHISHGILSLFFFSQVDFLKMYIPYVEVHFSFFFFLFFFLFTRPFFCRILVLLPKQAATYLLSRKNLESL